MWNFIIWVDVLHVVTVRRLCHRIPFLESLFLVFHSKIPTSLYIHLKKGLKGIHEIMMSESVKQETILFYSKNRERERERESEQILVIAPMFYHIKVLWNMKNQLIFSHYLGLSSFFWQIGIKEVTGIILQPSGLSDRIWKHTTDYSVLLFLFLIFLEH